MPHRQLKEILEDVKALSMDEQRELRAWLDRVCTPTPTPMTEEEFAHQLRATGLLSEVKPPIADFTPYQHRQPIETTGEPLSQVVIEERR